MQSRPRQQRQPPKWLINDIAVLATPGEELGHDREAVIAKLRIWLTDRWYPYVDTQTIVRLCNAARLTSQSTATTNGQPTVKLFSSPVQDEESLLDIFATLNVLARDAVADIVTVLSDLEKRNDLDVQSAVLVLENLMFVHDKSDVHLPLEVRILQEAMKEEQAEMIHTNVCGCVNEITQWKAHAESLEQRVTSLELELENLKKSCNEKCTNMTKSFDFWAQIVLSELHTQGAAEIAARKELQERLDFLEETMVGKSGSLSGRKGNRMKKTRRKSSSADSVSQPGNQSPKASASNGYVVANTSGQADDQEERMGKSGNLLKQARHGTAEGVSLAGDSVRTNGTDPGDSEDQQLMLAFKKALGSHFSGNFAAEKDTKVFRNGKWQWTSALSPTW